MMHNWKPIEEIVDDLIKKLIDTKEQLRQTNGVNQSGVKDDTDFVR